MYLAVLIFLFMSLEKFVEIYDTRKPSVLVTPAGSNRRVIIRNSETGQVWERTAVYGCLCDYHRQCEREVAETLPSGHVNVGNKIGARGVLREIPRCVQARVFDDARFYKILGNA